MGGRHPVGRFVVMEDLGDRCKVVFAGLLLESAGKKGIGWGGGEAQPSSSLTHRVRNKFCNDDFALVSLFLHACHGQVDKYQTVKSKACCPYGQDHSGRRMGSRSNF